MWVLGGGGGGDVGPVGRGRGAGGQGGRGWRGVGGKQNEQLLYGSMAPATSSVLTKEAPV